MEQLRLLMRMVRPVTFPRASLFNTRSNLVVIGLISNVVSANAVLDNNNIDNTAMYVLYLFKRCLDHQTIAGLTAANRERVDMDYVNATT